MLATHFATLFCMQHVLQIFRFNKYYFFFLKTLVFKIEGRVSESEICFFFFNAYAGVGCHSLWQAETHYILGSLTRTTEAKGARRQGG